jgi:hypothetical protein
MISNTTYPDIYEMELACQDSSTPVTLQTCPGVLQISGPRINAPNISDTSQLSFVQWGSTANDDLQLHTAYTASNGEICSYGWDRSNRLAPNCGPGSRADPGAMRNNSPVAMTVETLPILGPSLYWIDTNENVWNNRWDFDEFAYCTSY